MKSVDQAKFEERAFKLANDLGLSDAKVIPCLVSLLMGMIDTVTKERSARIMLINGIHEKLLESLVTEGGRLN